MFITDTTKLLSYNTHSCLISNITHTKPPHLNPHTFAKKKDSSEDSSYKQNKPTSPLSLFSTKKILIQSAVVGVFALGFIDAGYSGDWSRIGVISRGTEDLLKTAAFLVVPFCIYVIFYLSKETNLEE